MGFGRPGCHPFRPACYADAAPFLALDAWFLAAQHGARVDQFPPFHLLTALPRLLAYQVANVFGGLPLYVSGPARIVVGGAVFLMTLALVVAVLRACRSNTGPVAEGAASFEEIEKVIA